MQVIQLYIEGTRVDMFKDESVSITDTIKNVKDVSKIFTEFTKTFSLPASKENNKLFKHFYNFDIVGGFDARVRVTAEIELNHIPYKKGFIKLEGVKLKNNKPNIYKVTFFGNTVSLKNKFGDDKLQDLTWLSNFNTDNSGNDLTFTANGIRNYLYLNKSRTISGVTYVNPIQVPLLTHTQRLYYDSGEDIADTGNLRWHTSSGGGSHLHGVKWNQLKYAIKIPIIVKAIEEQYGITFSTDFLNQTNNSYKDLYMWLHRAKGEVRTAGQVTEFTHFINEGDFTGGSGIEAYMSNGYLYFPNGAVDTELRVFVTPASGYTSVNYSYEILLWNTVVYSSGSGSGSRNTTIQNPAVMMPYSIQITTTGTMGFSNVQFRAEGDMQGDGPFIDSFYTGAFTLQGIFPFIISQQMPEMKVIDFITGLFKMFNLVAYVDDNTIVVKTLDDFYSDGGSYDISEFIDVTNSEVDSALPFREVTYTYEGLDTFLSANHSQLFAKEWGKEEFRNNSPDVYAGGIFNYQIPFEHMKFERLIDINNSTNTQLQWGFCVDDNQESYIGKPILFYMQRYGNYLYSFVDAVDSDGEASSRVSTYYHFRPCNSNQNVIINQPSLNFFPEADEFTGVTNPNTLFAQYHTEYISDLFKTSKRVSKFTAYLPQRILLNYTLADRFVINNQSYKINSITTNLLTGKSTLELINE